MEDYRRQDSAEGSNEEWDLEGLAEDFMLTGKYVAQALEVALKPMRNELAAAAHNRNPLAGVPVEVVPDLVFLGDAEAARNKSQLEQMRITKVVNCSPQTVKTGDRYYGPGVEYMELWQDDLLDYCVMQDFDAVWAFITADGGGRCLLHCEQGVNRSGALALASQLKMQAMQYEANANEQPSPEDTFKSSWLDLSTRKGKVLTNPGFQRQLLLFARLGYRWLPSVNALWQTPKERKMAAFRELAERVARRVVSDAKTVPLEHKWRVIVFVRDGSMRGEMRMAEAFELATDEVQARAERRIQGYALKALQRHAETSEALPAAVPPRLGLAAAAVA